MTSRALYLRLPLQWKGWHLWLILLAGECLMTLYLQSQIITREVYHSLLAEQLDVQRIDDLFDMYKRMYIWGYAFMPLFTWLRIVFIALLLQMPLVLRFIDIPFRTLFRIVALASILMLVMQLGRIIHLGGIPEAAITARHLAYVPLSLTNILPLADQSSPAYAFFSHFNLFEMGWLFILYRGLVETGKVKKFDSFLVVLVMWTVILALQWALMLYFSKMSG